MSVLDYKYLVLSEHFPALCLPHPLDLQPFYHLALLPSLLYYLIITTILRTLATLARDIARHLNFASLDPNPTHQRFFSSLKTSYLH